MILEAKNIYYKYDGGKDWVLENISLDINAGEVVGLIGSSGRGKSTLGKIMAGQIQADKGEVLIDGAPVSKGIYSPVQLIYQHPELAVNPKWKLGKTLSESGDYDDDLRKEMGIRKEFLNRWPNELSGGELQRICVMRVLKPQTRFIIADEISTMLDVITQSQIWDIVLDYAKKEQIGILAITHNEHLAEAICTRTVHLK
ncbi:ABC transporter ATP-binding protein [Paenibacillus radicis (ex Xue et al. 2023)]|uniref:ATP-binding cassette domain-containing protein n=1 Tax=Paenibacillus radicis (ex Xue et al. 2023) TaxID=2972489 RepID=A0ABT1YBB3_9BACL|nr:ATP-binding cassette domain-containing protein [Paenibacillus radicis (ex Xue et al. 2023)]MCR8630192.1 ATP-binding cassette domain-containing protein [Paenibacillus radicis (ex Xue et al. 2023)]